MNTPTKPTNGNGSICFSKVLYILLAALFTISMALATAGMADLNRRLSAVEAIVDARGERVAVLEARYEVIQTQLDRIEKKLDEHMEGRR